MNWNVDPVIFTIGPFALRWYSLCFLLSFYLGYFYMRRRYRENLIPLLKLDSLLMHVMIGTLLGARLGHCLFYEPSVYLANPLRILRVWEGGLASHGAAIGVPTAMYIYWRRNKDIPLLWLFDRLTVATAMAGGFIRLGNLMNSEIIGKPSDVPWAMVFRRVDLVPRHPSMIYESAAYFGIALLLYLVDSKGRFKSSPGFMLGLFCVLVFGFRIGIEFLKERQVAFEETLLLDMGQILSIPIVLLGFVLILTAPRRRLRLPEPPLPTPPTENQEGDQPPLNAHTMSNPARPHR